MNDRWDPTSAAYAEAVANYEALLVDTPKRGLDGPLITPLLTDDSKLDTETLSVLLRNEYQPIARCQGELFEWKPRGTIAWELWADRDGEISVELVSEALDEPGGYIVSVYFTDGTALVSWPRGSVPTWGLDRRTVVRSRGDLEHDLRAVTDALKERLASGAKTLPVVDVETTRLRDAINACLFARSPRVPMWMEFARLNALFAGGALVVTAIVYALTQAWVALLIGGSFVVVATANAAREIWRRDTSFLPSDDPDLLEPVKLDE